MFPSISMTSYNLKMNSYELWWFMEHICKYRQFFELLATHSFTLVLRGWSIKFATGLITKIDIVQKVYKWSSCPFAKMILPKRGSFWQKDSLITHILWCTTTLDLFAPDPFKIMLSKGGSLWKLWNCGY